MQPKHQRELTKLKIKYSPSFLLVFLLFFSKIVWSQQCSNWLKVPVKSSFVRIGDLDVSGNTITVEATFNRTTPWDGIDLYQGDLVTKHLGPDNCNYLLRPSSAEITTSNGYYRTPTICPIELNKTYHVAMVYDGKTLKFYRNGFLMSQTAAFGSLYQNDFPTQIGDFTGISKEESLTGYINEVRIWNVVRTQDQLKSYMNQSLPDPQGQAGLLAYYTFDNLINKQGNTAWNGQLFGSAAINQTNSSCTFVADSCNIIPAPVCISNPPDFTFAPNNCSPLSIQFKTSLSGVQSYQWELGDGLQSNLASPLAMYPSEGQKKIKLKVQYANNCKDSISKTLPLWLTPLKMIQNRNPGVCYGDSILLQTSISKDVGFCWKTATATLPTAARNPYLKPTSTTTYSLITQTLGDNLVNNGSFENGNIGFSSDYTFSGTGSNAGVYYVGSETQNWYSGMAACNDHTSGNGNMLMVNGSDQQNAKAWAQTISVKPNTNYVFSVWAQSSNVVNPAQLQFSINEKKLDTVFTLDKNTCVWNLYYTIWNSGDRTSTTISIVNLNLQNTGNDYALDDLFFGELFFNKDSVTVSVNSIPKIDAGKDTTICKGTSVQLKSFVDQGTYILWTPASFLDNPNVAHPIATPEESITYIVSATTSIASGTNVVGCTGKDTVTVLVVNKPQVELTKDTSICLGDSVVLNASGTNITSYQWLPSTGLSNPNIANPVAKPSNTTVYTLKAFTQSCEAAKSVTVTVKPLPNVSISNNTSICEGFPVQLSAVGGIAYQWAPSTYLSSSLVANPIATPQSTINYKVSVTGSNGCVNSDSVFINVKPKPTFSVSPAIAEICAGDSILLTASGGNIYSWQPVQTVQYAQSASTKVFPTTTTRYKTIIQDNICQMIDSVFATVTVHSLPKLNIQKSNDIDCNNGEAHLLVTGADHYLWSSVAPLSGNNIANPIATPRQTSIYVVKGFSGEDCASVDSIEVKVLTLENNKFLLPSAFTPNNDKINDVFRIKYWGVVTEFLMSVYNRWGEKLFETNDPSQGWDGKYRGIEQPVGAYIYIISAKTLCGETSKKGTVMLIR